MREKVEIRRLTEMRKAREEREREGRKIGGKTRERREETDSEK